MPKKTEFSNLLIYKKMIFRTISTCVLYNLKCLSYFMKHFMTGPDNVLLKCDTIKHKVASAGLNFQQESGLFRIKQNNISLSSYCGSIVLYGVISCYIVLYIVIYCYILLYIVLYCYILLYSVIYCYILLYFVI